MLLGLLLVFVGLTQFVSLRSMDVGWVVLAILAIAVGGLMLLDI